MTRRLGAVWGWLEDHPRRALAIWLVFGAMMRLPSFAVPLEDDEGGFLMVAGQWHGHGDALYTDQWVDRPPLLLLTFKLAYLLGGQVVTLRLMSLAFGSIGIAAAWWAGRTINGSRGAVAAAAVTAGITASYVLDGYALTGEAIAGAFVLICCALVLEAKYGGHSRQGGVVLALGAGLFASLAFLTKQNFIDGGVYAAVLLGVKPHKTWRLMASGLVGIVAPLVVTMAWASSRQGPGLARLWVATFKFRQRSLSVIEDASVVAPVQRLQWLGVLFLVTGLLFLSCQLLVAARGADHRYSLRIALVVMFAYVVVSILVGASWWTHYLLQLAPVLAMGAALATRLPRRWLGGHAATTYTLLATAVAGTFGVYAVALGLSDGVDAELTAAFLRAASEPGDSVVLAYGSPNVIQMSGLATPYKYSWSLPVRTRDPHLKDLVGVLDSHQAPTWLVEVGDFNWWGLDTPAFRRARAEHYHVVADVCGHDVYLHDGLTRTLPEPPAC